MDRRTSTTLSALLAALLALLTSLSAVANDAPPVISADHRGAIDGSVLRYFIDDGGDFSALVDPAKLATAPWRSPGRGTVYLGFIEHPVWFHLRILNPSPRHIERYLQLDNAALQLLAVRSRSDRLPLSTDTATDTTAWSRPGVTHRARTEHLRLAPGATLDVYLLVASTTPLQLPMSLWQAEQMLGSGERSALLQGVYYGALLIMLIYNVMLYLHSKDARYAFYLVYLVSVGCFFLCVNGIGGAYLWPRQPQLTAGIALLSLSLAIPFGCWFSSRFLGLANTRPGLERALKGLGLGTALACLASALHPAPWTTGSAIMLAALTTAVNLATGAIRWYDRHPSGMLFTLAWFFLTIGALVMAAVTLGWMDRNLLTDNIAQLGSMLEFMILSVAMIQRLNAERRARFAAQRSALNFERQASQARQTALEAQRSATDELERRVQQRTRELQELNDKLRTLSSTDALTGLKNRRFFMERLHTEMLRSKRDGTPVSLLIIDVDHFKRVNDSHGHPVGDELLRFVAQHISAEVRRESDIVARQGGEEFAALLINNNPAQALAVAEKIRQRVANARYQTPDLELSCTVSIGVATLVPSIHSRSDELLKWADDALYHSKHAGRNRVSVARGQAAA